MRPCCSGSRCCEWSDYKYLIAMKAIFTTIENIDTDQIIPARFLKKTSKDGFGEEMFYDWRFNPDGTIKEDSVFAPYEGTAKGEEYDGE